MHLMSDLLAPQPTMNNSGKFNIIIYIQTYQFFIKQNTGNKKYTEKSATKIQFRISNHRSHVGDDFFDPDTDEATLTEHIQDYHNLNSLDLFYSDECF